MNSPSPLPPSAHAEADAVLARAIPMKPTTNLKIKAVLRFLLFYLVLATLLFLALRKAPLIEIWNSVSQLELWQIAILILINAIVCFLITLRWWIIIRAKSKTLSYLPLVLVRVAVFGVSYFTLGPQVGGEPLQVLYLQRKYGMTYTRATSTVIMDKLLEFLANFFLLMFGLMAVLQAGIFSTNGSWSFWLLIPLAILLLWPPIHIILMMRGIHPVGAALRAIVSRFGNPNWVRFIVASERMAGMFCQRYPRGLLMAVGVSLAAGSAMISEYALILSFLGIHLPGWQTFAAWTTSWLAFLVPLPGGLGALEASQVFTLGAFGVSAASAIGVTLLIRARDLVVGSLGLFFAGRAIRK